MQTAPGWGADGLQSATNAEANMSSLCNAMKSRSISVYTIGYDLNDAHTLDLLQACAGPGNFYDANDIENGLMQSLSSIAKKVRDQIVRLVD
jgi:hypothetical protein